MSVDLKQLQSNNGSATYTHCNTYQWLKPFKHNFCYAASDSCQLPISKCSNYAIYQRKIILKIVSLQLDTSKWDAYVEFAHVFGHNNNSLVMELETQLPIICLLSHGAHLSTYTGRLYTHTHPSIYLPICMHASGTPNLYVHTSYIVYDYYIPTISYVSKRGQVRGSPDLVTGTRFPPNSTKCDLPSRTSTSRDFATS